MSRSTVEAFWKILYCGPVRFQGVGTNKLTIAELSLNCDRTGWGTFPPVGSRLNPNRPKKTRGRGCGQRGRSWAEKRGKNWWDAS